MKNTGLDKTFLLSFIILLVFGFCVFLSASMRVLATDGEQFGLMIFKQFGLGIILGLVFCTFLSAVNYKTYKKYAFVIFIITLISMVLVLIPKIGVSINGARRWIYIGSLSFQPVTLLNFGFVVYWAAWLSSIKDKVKDIKKGLLPLLFFLSIIGVLLLLQPDTDSFLIICATGVAMLIAAGDTSFKHFLFVFLICAVFLGIVAYERPYVMNRIMTFFDSSKNSQTTSYQVQQSLITIGSGQFNGKGLGQSVQKYKFLPESISSGMLPLLKATTGVPQAMDSTTESFFAFSGFRIAIRGPDVFGSLLVFGIIMLVLIQSFVNICSTLGVIPYSGIPLAFFSQGGTAMLVLIAQMGVVLNVSKYKKISV